MTDTSKSGWHVQPHEYAEHMHEAWHCHVSLRQNITDRVGGAVEETKGLNFSFVPF